MRKRGNKWKHLLGYTIHILIYFCVIHFTYSFHWSPFLSSRRVIISVCHPDLCDHGLPKICQLFFPKSSATEWHRFTLGCHVYEPYIILTSVRTFLIVLSTSLSRTFALQSPDLTVADADTNLFHLTCTTCCISALLLMAKQYQLNSLSLRIFAFLQILFSIYLTSVVTE